jgi:hypothetical protein
MRPHTLPLGLATGALLTLGPALGVAAASTPSSSPSTPSSSPSTPSSSRPTSNASFSLRSASGTPGSTVEARLACLAGSRGIDAPGVFHQTRLGGAAGSLLAHYTVDGNAEPGRYTLHAHCGDHTLSARYTVTAAGDRHTGRRPGAGHEVSTTPKGAPATGGGATAGAPSPWLVGAGGAAALGAGAAAVAAARTRTSGGS